MKTFPIPTKPFTESSKNGTPTLVIVRRVGEIATVIPGYWFNGIKRSES